MINLSYITTSKNKMPYLKINIEKLLEHKKGDEEIVIIDGASTDGSREYVEELKKAGKIEYALSEPDLSESHALNKAFLAARGALIKIITDDDAYSYPVIEKCKKFMLEHPGIDILGTDGGSYKNEDSRILTIRRVGGYANNYIKWQKDHTPFEFSGVGIMFRRSSIPILGFWNLSFKAADAEYTYRTTAGPANLAWCLAPSFVFIRTPEGVTMNNMERMKEENRKLRKFYLNENASSAFVMKTKRLARVFINSINLRNKNKKNKYQSWAELYAEAGKWLEEKNLNKKPEFLWKK